MTDPPLPELEAERERLYEQLAATGDFRRGSISKNYRRCGKPNCACAQPDHPGHGPRYLWTRSVPGKMDLRYRDERDDLVDDLPPLPEFVRDLSHYIAQQDELFYSESDLRLFIAGLAATRLHLLQGVSGIGKTQLPLAFAKAINATAVAVPVGADWRTPQDLTGYYNAFERRFYESRFTQAVYQANCPAHLAQPFFVVLDEMNLSHSEQYFSDVLSAVEIKEQAANAPTAIDLMTAEVQPSPRWLLDGRRLPLPRNLWFVGTANQDETTVAFAEKTLDRSNVLELPSQPTGSSQRRPSRSHPSLLRDCGTHSRLQSTDKARPPSQSSSSSTESCVTGCNGTSGSRPDPEL